MVATLPASAMTTIATGLVGPHELIPISRRPGLEKLAAKASLGIKGRFDLGHQFRTKVPFRRSVTACMISSSVFITKGP